MLKLEKKSLLKNSGAQEKKRLLQDLSLASGLGLVIAIPLAGGAILGSYLDKRLGTTPIFTLFLILIGTIVISFYLYRIVKDNAIK